MSIFFLFFTAQAYRLSFNLECRGVQTRLGYIKKTSKPKYTIKLFTIPESQMQAFGKLSVYALDNHENAIQSAYDAAYKEMPFGVFKEAINILNNLIDGTEHRKIGNNSSAYSRTYKGNEDAAGNKLFEVEGLDVRTRIADQSVFEDSEKIKLIVGFQLNRSNGVKALTGFVNKKTVDSLNLDRDYLVRAGIVSEMGGGKPIEIIVIGTYGITEDDICKRIDAIIDGEEYRRQVGAALPNEKHSALMGGVGLSAGYHYHTKNFIFNLRSGVDHIWGKFRQSGPQNADTENMPKLGWGITLGTGVDYKFTEKATIGLEGGVRFSEFKIPKQDKPTDTKSSWFMAPYAQIVCGFYPTPDYSVSVFTGYFFPRTFSVKTEGTRITEGTKCKVDGIFGGLRFARYF